MKVRRMSTTGTQRQAVMIEIEDCDADGLEDQILVMTEALALYAKRNLKYRDNWKRMGWRGQLIRVRERSERLWDYLWDAQAPTPTFPVHQVRDEIVVGATATAESLDVDDALDLINFAGFLVRAVRTGNRDGTWWSR